MLSLNPFEIRARVLQQITIEISKHGLVLIPLKSGQGYYIAIFAHTYSSGGLNPFEIRARVLRHERMIDERESRLNPFEIRARVLPLKKTKTKKAACLNPFEIRARVLPNARDTFVENRVVLIPLKSGQGYYRASVERAGQRRVLIPLKSGQGYYSGSSKKKGRRLKS